MQLIRNILIKGQCYSFASNILAPDDPVYAMLGPAVTLEEVILT